uniref:NAC domain-containing protein n=1 Tax=Fagus sylvatica TaxID=28930 RepID=A0A2N9G893_FAGSY
MATGADTSVQYKGVKVGCKKALVYCLGKAPNGTKTDWLMHEFRVHDAPKIEGMGMRLDDWVLCRIYKKTKKSSRGSAHKKEHVSQSQKECNGISTKQCANEDVLVEDTIRKLFEDMDADQYNNNNNQLGTQTINSSYQHSQNQFVNVPQSGDTLLHQIPTYAHHQQPSELGPLSHMGSNTYVHHQQAPKLVNHNHIVEPLSTYMVNVPQSGDTLLHQIPTYAHYQQPSELGPVSHMGSNTHVYHQQAPELVNHNQIVEPSSYMVSVPQPGDTSLHQIPTYAHHQQTYVLGPLSHMGSNRYVYHQQANELVNHNQVVEPSSYMGSTTFAQYQQTAFELGNHNQKDDSSSCMGNNMNIGSYDDQWEFSFPEPDDLFKCFLGF